MVEQTFNFPSRSVIKNDHSLMICLPKQWCKHVGLQHRDKVKLDWNVLSNSLILSKAEVVEEAIEEETISIESIESQDALENKQDQQEEQNEHGTNETIPGEGHSFKTD